MKSTRKCDRIEQSSVVEKHLKQQTTSWRKDNRKISLKKHISIAIWFHFDLSFVTWLSLEFIFWVYLRKR